MDRTIKLIKEKIYKISDEKGIKIDRVILFGSRARGDFKHNSDWDILIVVNKDLPFQEKRELSRIIRKRLAEFLIPSDIIVKSKEEINYYKDFMGSVVREALKEGINI